MRRPSSEAARSGGVSGTSDVAPAIGTARMLPPSPLAGYRVLVRSDGPLVVAHRGSSDLIAEHTLAAYEQAIIDGADAVECDVRMTRDGHLVCVHDRRLHRTSNGRGLVSESSLADLAELDFGSWKYGLPESADELVAERELDPDHREARRRLLTFDRLLDLVTDSPRPMRLLVETKHPTRYGNMVEEKLVDALRRHGLASPADPRESPVTMMSFSPLAVRRVRVRAPRLPTVLLMESVPLLYRDGTLPFGIGIAGPDLEILRAHPHYAERVRSQGNQVYVWTVDAPTDIDLVLSLGVDAVISNRPSSVLTRLGRDAHS
ncbi:MAG: Glycerophosphodiester phosphodiesterase [Actinomycetia bacterium]|nr:Glycerophosphodiester phosphodiesterase [Actinomycetes bacterium]MDQ1654428.1 glycerophosphoryl diester phosphodiesterase [Cryptosporangiaceae bacterium]MDQ1655449.1 glycerophosphoryl diester phosphodiesterase [Cryptosporangiaceae bacterium]